MTTFADIYSTGTIHLTTSSAAFTGTGVLWSDIEQGDLLVAQGLVGIVDTITGAGYDAGTLRSAWTGAGGSTLTYQIIKLGKGRFDPALTQSKLREMLALLDNAGIIYAVTGTDPDVGVGEDGQYALKTNGGAWKQWLKVAGAWVLQSTPVGINNRGTYSSLTAYVVNDVVAYNGSAYLNIQAGTNKQPDTQTAYWAVIGAKGDIGLTGNTGPAGPGGNTGPAGADGKTLRSGSGAPSNLLGNNGDFYIATNTLTLYGPKVTGTWPAGTSIVGSQGIQGATGSGLAYSASGTLAQRSAFDNQVQGYGYLQTDTAPFRLWVKASNTSADWAGPTYIGGAAAVGDLGSVVDSILETFDYGVAA